MVRHLVRHAVKFGHWDEFVAAYKAFNQAAVKAGMPAYRLYSSQWGTFNEAFSEAEYESSGDIERLTLATMKDPDCMAAYGALGAHLADGQTRDYVLSEENLG